MPVSYTPLDVYKRQVLIDEKIQIVINQWGLPFIPAYVLKKASRGIPVKIIAVYHNDPSTNGRLKDVEIAMEKNRTIVVYLGLKDVYKRQQWICTRSH